MHYDNGKVLQFKSKRASRSRARKNPFDLYKSLFYVSLMINIIVICKLLS